MSLIIRLLLLLLIFPIEGQGAQEAKKEVPKKAVSEVPATAKEANKDKDAVKAATKEGAKKATKLPVQALPEMSMGSKKAPVVMINYSSLSCGHCAQFHSETLPKIKEKYIDPGHLRVIFRDFPGDQVSLRAHQLAWCKGEMKYLDIVKLLYSTQEKWLLAPNPIAALKSIALQNGITSQQFDACLKNQELMDKILTMRLEGQKKYDIKATPTIIINTKIYQKALSLEEIEAIMKPLLASVVKKTKKG